MAEDTAHPGDEQLLDRVRAGDNAAYETLYREHLDGARHLARILVGNDHADELVAESFAKVLASLRNGGGPTTNFRSYLHVTIRNGYRDGLRATSEAPVSDQPWLLDDTEPPPEEMVEGLDETVAVDALSSLPESWQQVLWHVEVEGRKPAEVAQLMDMKAGAVSSLAHRAREGLKRAYLDLHAGPAPAQAACQWTHARMGQYARGDLGARAEQKFDAHVADCPSCQASFLAVDAVNRKLAAYVLPIVLLGATGGSKGLLFLVGAGAAGGAAAGATGGTTSGASGGGSFLNNPAGVGVAAAVAVAVVAAGAFAVGQRGGDKAEPTAAPRSQAAPPQKQAPPQAPPKQDQPTPKPPPSPAPPPPPPLPAPKPVVQAPTPLTSPSQAPTQPVPGPTEVVPVAPVEHDVSECDADGSLDIPTTKGVDYALTSGDGKTGPWTVKATAQRGYVIAKGADSSWSGDLGQRYPCTDLVDVTTDENGQSGHWDVTADVDVLGGPNRPIDVVFSFNSLLSLAPGGSSGGNGWTCQSLLIGAFTVSCRYDYAGTPPPPVSVAVDELPILGQPPSGTATLKSDGAEVESQPFG